MEEITKININSHFSRSCFFYFLSIVSAINRCTNENNQNVLKSFYLTFIDEDQNISNFTRKLYAENHLGNSKISPEKCRRTSNI